MLLLPYRKIVLSSPLPPEAVVRLLENAVEPKRWFRLGAGARPFEGSVTQATFDIRRIISYRNSFLPQLRGTITPEGNGSRIAITMQLHVTVAIFMAVWLSAMSSGRYPLARQLLAGVRRPADAIQEKPPGFF